MKVIICGIGYVGVTAAACLIKDGHHVVGIDVNDSKVADVAAGRSPVSEPGVGELL
jgi:GDP-mannose 6-dehydrogenase